MVLAAVIVCFIIEAKKRRTTTTFVARTDPTELSGLLVPRRSSDLGNIVSGEDARTSFVLNNYGAEPINIDGVETSCGCTTTALANNRIEPNASTEIRVSIDTDKLFPGRFQKDVLCHLSMGLRHATVLLSVTGNMSAGKILVVCPERLDLGNVVAGATIERKLYIRGNSSQLSGLPASCVLSLAGEPLPPAINALLIGKPTGNGQPDIKRIIVRILVGHGASGTVQRGQVIIRIQGDINPEIVVAVRATLAAPASGTLNVGSVATP
jgi:hypothetical protein